MCDGGYVADEGYFDFGGLQCADCRLTSLTGTLDVHFYRANTLFLGTLSGYFAGLLSGKCRALTRSAEAEAAGAAPRQCVTVHVGECYDCVVEGSVNVDLSFFDLSYVALFLDNSFSMSTNSLAREGCRPLSTSSMSNKL